MIAAKMVFVLEFLRGKAQFFGGRGNCPRRPGA